MENPTKARRASGSVMECNRPQGYTVRGKLSSGHQVSRGKLIAAQGRARGQGSTGSPAKAQRLHGAHEEQRKTRAEGNIGNPLGAPHSVVPGRAM